MRNTSWTRSSTSRRGTRPSRIACTIRDVVGVQAREGVLVPGRDGADRRRQRRRWAPGRQGVAGGENAAKFEHMLHSGPSGTRTARSREMLTRKNRATAEHAEKPFSQRSLRSLRFFLMSVYSPDGRPCRAAARPAPDAADSRAAQRLGRGERAADRSRRISRHRHDQRRRRRRARLSGRRRRAVQRDDRGDRAHRAQREGAGDRRHRARLRRHARRGRRRRPDA